MKKLVFIFLMLFCLTGCANSVELNFNEDINTKINLSFTLDEFKARLNEPNLSDSEAKTRIESIRNFRNAFTDPYSDLLEEKSFGNNGRKYIGVYEYTYSYSNFYDNSILNNCFESFGVDEDKDRLYIFAEGKSKCGPFKLIVKADDRMISSNENSKEENQYIWKIKEENNDIYMAISKTPTTTKIKVEPSSFNVVDLICCIVALLIGIAAFVINKKYKESE